MIHLLTLKKIRIPVLIILFISTICMSSFPVMATSEIPIPTSSTENWPSAPEINSASAILMELETGTILYAKDIHTKQYPASITKILTAYIATTHSSSNDQVTMSSNAINSISWWSDSNIGIKVGNSITMEEALYAVMVASANEVAYALAEHISGNLEDFSNLMNETATELGAINSNFMNPSGLHNDNHYTTAYDMAMIAKAYFANDFHCILSSTSSYTIPQTSLQPNDSMYFSSKNRLFSGQTYAYEYLLGSKTGYTEKAQQTLVSAAKKNGMTLICVVLNAKSPYQFEDTLSLFQYGFSNFQTLSVLQNDTTYSIHNTAFFNTISSDLGASKSILSFDSSSYIVLPNQVSIQDTSSTLQYNPIISDSTVASVFYKYNGIPVGSASIYSTLPSTTLSDIDNPEASLLNANVSFIETTIDHDMIIINIKYCIFTLLGISTILILIFLIKEKFQSYAYSTGYSPYLRNNRNNFKRKNSILKILKKKLSKNRRHRRFH